MSTTKAPAAKAPAKKAALVPAKSMSRLPVKTAPKAPAAPKAASKAPAKAAPKAKTTAKAPAKKNSQEAMLARVEAVRLLQRESGHFDCFGRAGSGYCDQGGCSYHAECLSVSQMIHSM
jgi:hypothetical protein